MRHTTTCYSLAYLHILFQHAVVGTQCEQDLTLQLYVISSVPTTLCTKRDGIQETCALYNRNGLSVTMLAFKIL